MYGRSQVRFLSGTQTFSLSHARDMLIISFSHLDSYFPSITVSNNKNNLKLIKNSLCSGIVFSTLFGSSSGRLRKSVSRLIDT